MMMSGNLKINPWKNDGNTGRKSLTGVSDVMPAEMHVQCAFVRTGALRKAAIPTG